MKKIVLIISVIIISSCTSYNIKKDSRFYSSNSINNFVSKNHFSTNNPNKIRNKILRSLEKYGYAINKGKSKDGKNISLIKYGKTYITVIYEKTNKKEIVEHGYFLINYTESKKDSIDCILYEIQNKSISFTCYKIPIYCDNWECVKTSINYKNNKLPFGRVIFGIKSKKRPFWHYWIRGYHPPAPKRKPNLPTQKPLR